MPRRLTENTLPSFSAALDEGADGIELDVHATSDGVVVVHHDPTVDGRKISRTEWAALRKIELDMGLLIPTLRDVCALVQGRAELFVEIKGAEMETQVVEALEGYAGPTAIHSFDHATIARLARRRVPYRLGLLYEEPPTRIAGAMREHGAQDVWPDRRLVTQRLIEEVHAEGGRVIPWTVNDRDEALRLAAWGVDGLCTDDVTLLPRP